MSSNDLFEALQGNPAVKALWFAWAAGEDVRDDEPLLFYCTRLHVLNALRPLMGQGDARVRELMNALVAELAAFKAKIPLPFQANYARVRDLAVSNFEECVKDQQADRLSRDLYTGFLKLMGVFQSLDVFDAFAADPQHARLLGLTAECKNRGVQVRDLYNSRKDFYDNQPPADQSPTPAVPAPAQPHLSMPTPTPAQPSSVQQTLSFATPQPNSARLQNPAFDQAFPPSLLNYQGQAEPLLPFDSKNVLSSRPAAAQTASKSATFDKVKSFAAALPHVREAKEHIDRKDLAGVYVKLIAAFNEVAGK